MQKKLLCVLPFVAAGMLLPLFSQAQGGGIPDQAGGLQAALDTVYNSMIAKCAALTDVARLVAGFATLLYIGSKIWENLARAEPIDLFPLLRPFGIAIALGLFPHVIGFLNGALQPITAGTSALADNSNQAITTLLQEREEELKKSNDWQMYVGQTGSGDLQKWESLSGQADDSWISGLSNRVKFEMSKMTYNLQNSFKVWLSELLELIFEAAALCINTVRMFYLVILALVGPIVFALSIFSPLRHVLTDWLGYYINIFLWLPIVNILSGMIGIIQGEMIKLDIQQLQEQGATYFGKTDAAYLIFLLMAIAGYFTVPSIANKLINPRSFTPHLEKVTHYFSSTGKN